VDRGDGDHHVEDLLEREMVADLVSALRGGEERPACGDHPGAVVVEERVVAIRVLEQLRGDVALAGGKGEEPVQPGGENRSRGLAVHGLGRLADGVDLVDEEGFKQLPPAGEVAVQSGHPDAGASRDLGHRHLSLGIGERGSGGREDLVAVPLGIGTSRGGRGLGRGHLHSKWTGYPLSATVKRTCYPLRYRLYLIAASSPRSPRGRTRSPPWTTDPWDAPASRSASCAWAR
jgi:hypothetical protein